MSTNGIWLGESPIAEARIVRTCGLLPILFNPLWAAIRRQQIRIQANVEMSQPAKPRRPMTPKVLVLGQA
jgi:hypothetical protein